MGEKGEKHSGQINRILWNAGRESVDEVVVQDCMVHLEQLDTNSYYLAIYPKSQPDERVMVQISARKGLLVDVSEEIAWDEVDEHGGIYSGPADTEEPNE